MELMTLYNKSQKKKKLSFHYSMLAIISPHSLKHFKVSVLESLTHQLIK